MKKQKRGDLKRLQNNNYGVSFPCCLMFSVIFTYPLGGNGDDPRIRVLFMLQG